MCKIDLLFNVFGVYISAMAAFMLVAAIASLTNKFPLLGGISIIAFSIFVAGGFLSGIVTSLR